MLRANVSGTIFLFLCFLLVFLFCPISLFSVRRSLAVFLNVNYVEVIQSKSCKKEKQLSETVLKTILSGNFYKPL